MIDKHPSRYKQKRTPGSRQSRHLPDFPSLFPYLPMQHYLKNEPKAQVKKWKLKRRANVLCGVMCSILTPSSTIYRRGTWGLQLRDGARASLHRLQHPMSELHVEVGGPEASTFGQPIEKSGQPTFPLVYRLPSGSPCRFLVSGPFFSRFASHGSS